MSKLFDTWVENEFKEITRLANEYKNKVKEYGEVCVDKFSDLPRVKHIYKNFKFFVDHNLHEHLKTEFEKL